MILNISRAKSFDSCRRKAFNYSHRRLEGPRSMNLVDGGAFHAGVAAGRSSKDWKLAKQVAKELFEEDVKKSTIPEEQLYLIEDHWELTEAMLACFEKQYEHETYHILQPECTFDVPLPNSMHNCIFHHWVDSVDGQEYFTAPTPEAILGHRVCSPHGDVADSLCACWQPHRFTGKTDAIVNWNNNIWLDEYKTTAIQGQQFWDQWQMDVQPTGYIYGIWKSLGIRPRGFLLNSIFKPTESQVSNWNSKRKDPRTAKSVKDYIAYSREGFLRTEEDLAQFERDFLQICIDWEAEVTSGSEQNQLRTPFKTTKGSHTCMSYNRKCDYWGACLSHEAPEDMAALNQRGDYDYVEEKVYQIQPAAK